jgi:quinol monooxygenase YgiN
MAMLPDGAVKDPAKPLCIVHHVRIRPECTEDYRAYAREHYILPANGEPGCEVYDVWQDSADPCHFIVVERWSSLAALEAHMAKPYVLGGLAKAMAMQDGPMQSYYLSSAGFG